MNDTENKKKSADLSAEYHELSVRCMNPDAYHYDVIKIRKAEARMKRARAS